MKAIEDYVIHDKAVLVDDAVKDPSLSREKINNIRKQSNILDEFLLYLPNNSRIYYKTSDFYNDYSGGIIDVILYRHEDWSSLMQNLSRHIMYLLLRINYYRKDRLLEILTKWHYDK